jgi:hypothetical protein
VEWSALHGIAQVLTPVFRFVHDTVATARKVVYVRGSAAAAPPETATGLVFPYRAPRRRALEVRRTFRLGLEHAAQSSPPPKVGGVLELHTADLNPELSEPAVLRGRAADWPALHLWTESGILAAVPATGPQTARYDSMEADSSDALRGPSRGRSKPVPRDLTFETLSPYISAGTRFADLLTTQGRRQRADHGLFVSIGAGDAFRPKPGAASDAWSAVTAGRRRLAFCPPGSDAELLGGEADLFSPGDRDRLSRRGLDIRECEQGPGDLVFVPAGWWMQARCLEPSLAVSVKLEDVPTLASGARAKL